MVNNGNPETSRLALIPELKNGSLVQEKLDNAKAAIDDWVKLLQERGAGRHP